MSDAELRAKAEAATPCELCDGTGRRVIPRGGAFDCPECDGSGYGNGFAASPNAVIALLDRVEAAEAAVERVRSHIAREREWVEEFTRHGATNPGKILGISLDHLVAALDGTTS